MNYISAVHHHDRPSKKKQTRPSTASPVAPPLPHRSKSPDFWPATRQAQKKIEQ